MPATTPIGPTQPAPVHALYALMAGAGVVSLAQLPGRSPGHPLMMLLGVVLLALAFLLPTLARSRAGLHGYRGQTRTDNLVFLIVAVVLVVCAFSATTTTTVIYIGLGVVAAITYFLVLRKHRLVAR